MNQTEQESKMAAVTLSPAWHLKAVPQKKHQSFVNYSLKGDQMRSFSLCAFHWRDEKMETWRVFIPTAQWVETNS